MLGCYDDSTEAGLGFAYQAAVHDKTTFEVCAGACDQQQQQQQQRSTQQTGRGNNHENSKATKLDVAAIDAGNHCFCGTTTALAALHKRSGRPAAECEASHCHANTSETGCGGVGRMVAYSYKNCKPTSSSPRPPPLPLQGSPEWPVVGPPQCRFLRSDFPLPAIPVRVTAFVAAMGYVELWINGKKAGEDAVLEPGWTQFDRRLLYVTYDVSDLFRAPNNQSVGVALGNGWPGHLKHVPTFKLLLKFEFGPDSTNADREPLYITSTPSNFQGTWKGPIQLDDIYGGETYDARLEITGFGGEIDRAARRGPLPDAVAAVAYEDPSTAHAVLSSQMMNPIRALELLEAKEITSPHAGVTVVDFGQNIAGWGRLTLKNCAAGTTIKMSFAEVLHATNHSKIKCDGICDDGLPCSEAQTSSLLDPLHNCTWVAGMVNMQYLMCTAHHGSVTGDRCSFDLYTCKGGAEEAWEPRFTYHAELQNLGAENGF